MNECTYIQRLEDTVENALVKVVLTRAPGIDGIGNHAQDGLDALFLAEVEIEAPAEVFDNLGTGVKAGTSAGAHHLHEEHDAFGVFAHGEVTLDAQGFVRVEGVRATALDVGEVPIGSGSMRHTFDPLTAERFASSLSHNRVPSSSQRAFRPKKTFRTASRRSAWTKKLR